MWKAIQPVLLPIALLSFEYIAIHRGWLQDDMFVGALFGISIFWLIWGILSNKSLLVKAPWLVEWAPFLGSARPTAMELRGPYVRGKTFRLADVSEGGTISGKTFEDCTILGPAILAPKGTTMLQGHKWVIRNRGGNVWPLDPAEQEGHYLPRDGSVTCENCRFINCTFDNVGLAQPKELFYSSEDMKIVGEVPKSLANDLRPIDESKDSAE